MVTPLRNGRDSLVWLSPSPTWGDAGDLAQPANREQFLRPAILRFAHDAFMDELLATLAYHPTRLGEWRAVPETWEKPMRSPPAAAKLALAEPVSKLSVRQARRVEAPAAGTSLVKSGTNGAAPLTPGLKLYQPVQLRHYLVAASLVCERPGLPDRRIDGGKQERAGFVLRRILLPDGETKPAADSRTWDECAFISSGARPTWQRVKNGDARGDKLVVGEERLSLFSVGFDETPERKRRLFSGTIPVGRREAYLAAGVQAPSNGASAGAAGVDTAPAVDPRKLLFQMQVTAPWSELVQQVLDQMRRLQDSSNVSSVITDAFGDPPAITTNDELGIRAKDQAQTISWYALLDFERFLASHAPRIHDVLTGARNRSELDAVTEEPLVAWLEGVKLDAALLGPRTKPHLLAALTTLAQDASIGDKLEAVDVAYDSGHPDPRWPVFLFPLADVTPGKGPFPFTVDGVDESGDAGLRDAVLAKADAALDELADLVEKALPAAAGETAPPEIHVESQTQFDNRTAWFTIRCVYERPNCGPFDPPVVSEPTQPFQMAGYFDPDAPVRPARIPMPFDISPAGLRKFPKGATLMISDMLCGQLKRIRRFSLGDLVLSVLPWPFHKDLPSPDENGPCADTFGDFCSLSIPIVTLCALILLIILVALFDIFFKWLPLLFFCFPVKLLSGKPK